MSWLKRSLAVLLVGFAAPAAMAETVEYRTVGVFAAGVNGGTVVTTASSTKITIGDFELTYNNVTPSTIITMLPDSPITVAQNASFGEFTVSDSSTNSLAYQAFAGTQFTLTIYQLDPDPGLNDNGVIVGSLTGSLQASTSTETGSTIVLNFSGSTVFQIPPAGTFYPPVVTYSVDPKTFIYGTTDNRYPGEIGGQVSAVFENPPSDTPVPLPASAWTASALLAGIALMNRRRAVAA
jgi:hypothetical protein